MLNLDKMHSIYKYTSSAGSEGVYFAPEIKDHYVVIGLGYKSVVWDENYKTKGDEDSFTISHPDSDTTYTFDKLSISDSKTIFPDSIRTYKSLQAFEDFLYDKLTQETSYTMQVSIDEAYSFTVDDNDDVLELIFVDAEGDLFVRDSEQWMPITGTDDHPTIFDKTVIDIEPSDVESAVDFWDSMQEEGSDLSKNDILHFAALVQ